MTGNNSSNLLPLFHRFLFFFSKCEFHILLVCGSRSCSTHSVFAHTHKFRVFLQPQFEWKQKNAWPVVCVYMKKRLEWERDLFVCKCALCLTLTFQFLLSTLVLSHSLYKKKDIVFIYHNLLPRSLQPRSRSFSSPSLFFACPSLSLSSSILAFL